jgi:hypothetical protein
MASDEDISSAVVSHIEPWTLILGAAGALAAGLHWGWRIGAGVGAGVLLSWLNYRWLKQGVISLSASLPEQSGAGKGRVPRGVYVKLIGRFALLLAVVCVILWRFERLTAAFLGGFFAPVAGVLAAMIAHLVGSMRRT